MTDNFILILSLISLGFFGGFSHCSLMCSPFVLTQIQNRLENTKLKDFSNFQKLKNLALIPYHLGRITTYSIIGFCCSLLNKNIEEFTDFRFISAFLLFLASLFFLKTFLEKGFFNFRLRIKTYFLDSALSFFQKKISFLFKRPQGFNGYLLGLILGLIPCGLLYGAFVTAAAINQPFLGAFGMFCFGISTFPALFFAGIGGNFFLKNSGFKIIAKIIILINAIMLFLMALRLVL